ncbi:hypothetical protein GCM10010193_34290 [Kitasatospora atroaurantiaca]|uniref:Mycothiol maleylpyruvate isomerase-like protein n=1 Tax=Kitasatospora atroaurantiaca TaxID=285545 RepID=A0A561ENV5_9ACTN|nr:hypothetical protein FB465_2290 [Kitasatospora atroaurantiaca]
MGLAVTALRTAPPAADWDALAGSSEWGCWETVEHLADGLFSYAAQLAPEAPPMDGFIPFVWTRQKPGGPANVLLADRGSGPAGLLQILEVGGTLLVAMVRTASPRTRAFHGYGVADPEGFAAMGVVETLVHTHDVAEGLGVAWVPPADLCDRVLGRLFPDAPVDTERWPTLLWATGRAELPGRPRLTSWRWYSAPRD